MTTFPFTPDTVDRRPPGPAARPHDESPAATCTMVVHLGPGHSTSGLLKVLSVLHSRRVAVSHVQYVQCPNLSAVMIVECSPSVASLETVRKSVANAVPVVSVSMHTAPTRDAVRRPRARRGR